MTLVPSCERVVTAVDLRRCPRPPTIDATKPETMEEAPATEFFKAVAGNLHREGAARGVGHLVILVIS